MSKTKEEEEVLAPEEGVNKEATKQPVMTQERLKRMQKEQAMQMADYKRRLRDSVEVKELQVKELELNVRYFNVQQELKRIQPLIEAQQAEELAEKQQREAKMKESKSELQIIKSGKPRTEEEIQEAKEEVKEVK